ncbi:Rhodanese-like domain protein [Planctomycetes bacterium CA13]|uniref:Rhodanese-like domain protein n=1 Tax=Novipirellula herctigrandis TaxID=2527986 RepID=A0A5C5ZC55_9BACT|nr:Rhodanese-like domain protein [Planctomycetes bacterium CA13]
MFPLHFAGITATIVTLLTGFGFGFVLERAGFGNSRNLAAQFYLYDMRVLKVMFTAIVTAMVLLFAGSAIGVIDMTRIWVPPTYLGPAVLGGFLLGLGFIIGGYCPGTSVVSASTLKIDGILFVLGVTFGVFVFSQTVLYFSSFWTYAGAFGPLTLYDLVHVDAGFVVLAVVLMAIGAFAAAEWSERVFDPEFTRGSTGRMTPPIRRLRYIASAVAILLAACTLMIGQPDTKRLMVAQSLTLDERLQTREPFIDAAELAGLMHNNQIELVLLDIRSEADYNQFHLLDAHRMSIEELEGGWAKPIAPAKVIVLMSNDEDAAMQAWRRVAVYSNANPYILAGGINRWLDVFMDGQMDAPGPLQSADGDDRMRYKFSRATGARHPESRPEAKVASARTFESRVKVRKPIHAEGGGCG